MHHKARLPNAFFGTSLRPDSAALAILVLLLFLIFVFLFLTLTAQPAQAQTYKVIYNFTGGADGAGPVAGLTIDRAGNLYGTTLRGGYLGAPCQNGGCGTAFRLSRQGLGWDITTLYTFTGEDDGTLPYGRVIAGPYGSRYGIATNGTVFGVRVAPTTCQSPPCAWTESVLYVIGGDGGDMSAGDLTCDQAGNIYGTSADYSNVYELTPSGGNWTHNVLYSFAGGNDGRWPFAGVIFDRAGNLYGTTLYGGTYNWGTVFQLTPSRSGWTEKILYSFQGRSDGGLPMAGVVMDNSGNLYGATSSAGFGSGGTIFELTPSGGNWTFTLLHGFSGGFYSGPEARLVMDSAGNLYGTKACYLNGCGGNYGYGATFKLTSGSGGWSYTSLHNFAGGSDGGDPHGGVILAANGNVYGTTNVGGAYGYGVIYEITP